MKITFRKLVIKNFKGIEELEVNYDASVTNILGANHTGKTTTADAIMWVLFGKNSEGQAKFGISPKDKENNIIPNLENVVELTMAVDEHVYALRKVRKGVTNKKDERTGNTIECFINDRRLTLTDYQEEIKAICSENLFKAITSPQYFNSLTADQQRALLVKMVGETSAEQVAAGDKDFAAMLNEIGGDDIKAYREHLSYMMKQVKESLNALPERITENEEMRQQLQDAGTNFAAMRKRLGEIEEAIKKYDEQLLDSTAAVTQQQQQRAEIRRQIGEIEKEQQAITYRIDTENRKQAKLHDDKVADLEYQLKDVRRDIDKKSSEIGRYEQDLQSIELLAADFRKRWQEVEAETFEWDTSKETCPTCGQPLPTIDVERLKKDANDRWMNAHMEKQDALDAEAAKMKEQKRQADAEIYNGIGKLEILKTQETDIARKLDEARQETVALSKAEDDERWAELQSECEQLKHQLNIMTAEVTGSGDNQIILQNKADLQKQRDQLKADLGRENLIAMRTARIEELSEQMRTLNQQLTELESKDYTANRFENAMIRDLESRVNGLFDLVRFSMFETLLNGSTRPTCVMTMHGVPYNDLSNSEKINAGIDLIKAMSRYNDVYAPIIIDNAESCNHILPTECQQIRLVVSMDEKLTIVN
ncbi:AAA family ATPase [Hoylesella timonensis]|uniref:Rad50/SbcC-type AAA domain-containing protein n=1 Tax=Hoylesella timonensis TaxID=386414 RepID=A0A2N6Q6T0_9BACT|nr:AAA family ATPase [Hoylesella timonensis]PMC10710.1 hypothetical protein CJ232_04220 [Hoylesella timonensis]